MLMSTNYMPDILLTCRISYEQDRQEFCLFKPHDTKGKTEKKDIAAKIKTGDRDRH